MRVVDLKTGCVCVREFSAGTGGCHRFTLAAACLTACKDAFTCRHAWPGVLAVGRMQSERSPGHEHCVHLALPALSPP